MTRRYRVISLIAVFVAFATLAVAQKPAPQPSAPASTAAQQKALENYQRTCQPCHGPEGKSTVPNMSLADGEWKHGNSVAEIARTIAQGIPGTPMLPNKDKFTKAEIDALARLVRSFDPDLGAKEKK
jgi:mono/diheme cytochrome c family protein